MLVRAALSLPVLVKSVPGSQAKSMLMLAPALWNGAVPLMSHVPPRIGLVTEKITLTE